MSDRSSSQLNGRRPVIALTGATGFIGRHLVTRLTTAGYVLRLLIRDPNRSPGPAEVIVGSLGDEASLQRLLDGVDAVVHCAGRVRGCTEAEFIATNTLGTARLAALAGQLQPQPRFLLLSSLAAREPLLSDYAASKRRAELALATVASGMRWAALRPPAVYGPGDREMLPLLRCMARGFSPVLGQRDARLSLLYISDLVEAVVHWLEDDFQGIFELHDGHQRGYGWQDLRQFASSVVGRGVMLVPVPGVVLKLVANLSLHGSQFFKRDPMLTPGKVRELRHPDWVCDNAPLFQASRWRPRVEFAEGLRLTLNGASSENAPFP